MVLKLFLISIIGLLCYSTRARLQTDYLQDFMLENMMWNAFNPLEIDKIEETNVFLPSGAVTDSVQFFLYTRDNPKTPYVLLPDVGNVRRSPFRSERPTKIIIHGWLDSERVPWMATFRENYLILHNYNVINVDWHPISVKDYPTSAQSTRQIGEYLGQLLNLLETKSNLSLSNVHILGHSLGAHVAGFAGLSLSGAIGRITGMDPARPLFEYPILKDPNDRLDPTDAVFVDVIHTCAGTAGFIEPIGHADFYPNGGTFRQPGCSVLMPQYCSHARSHEFMAESILYPNSFEAVKCDNWIDYKSGYCLKSSKVLMGENISSRARGTYYLETNAESPFGRGRIKTPRLL